jgi:MYXO-CTERM domain-containing protein
MGKTMTSRHRHHFSVASLARSLTMLTLLVIAACSQQRSAPGEGVGEGTQAVVTSTVTTLNSSQQFTAPGSGMIGSCGLNPGAHFYVSRTIVPSSTSSFTLSTVASNSAGSTNLANSAFGPLDTLIFLYAGAFNPATPSANLIDCNDDLDPNNCGIVDSACLSSITDTLTGSSSYTLVITTFDQGVTGSIAVNVNGTPISVVSSMSATGGAPQSTAVSTAFATALSVTVLDQASNPLPGVQVNFSAPGSGASAALSASSATTNASGVASVTATANGTTGSYSITATIPGFSSSATFALTNTTMSSPTPASISVNSGTTPQSAVVNTNFATALAVTVRDSGNAPVSGVIVTFTAPSSGANATFTGGVTTITATTNGSGVASITPHAGTMAGSYSVTASVTGVSPSATFSLTNTAGAAATVAVSSGNNQTTTIGTNFGLSLVALVTDGFNNPVPGAAVAFTGPGSGASASFSPPPSTTDSSGLASTTATANGVSGGPYAVTASVSGATPASFSLTNSSCTFSLLPVGALIGPVGVSDTIAVTASNPACMWTATSSTPWLSGITASGTGSGTVSYAVAANPGVQRTGSISIGGQTFNITQISGCSFTLLPTSASVGASGGSDSIAISASDSSCPWTAASNDSWLTGVTASGTGSGSVAYSYASNVGVARSGSLTVAGQAVTISQATGCAISIAPTTATASATSGSGSISVTASDPACTWTAMANDAWISGVTASGTGSGTVAYTYASNVGVARSGSLTVAGQTVTISQAAGCTISILPTTATAGATAVSGSISVTTSDPACTWTATANDAWISGVTSSGTGSGTVSYSYGANVGPERIGTITISGNTFSLDQADGCTVSLGASSASATAPGGGDSFTITTSSPTCTWTASTTSTFITGLTTSGTGNGSVGYTVTANVGPVRTATVTVAGQSFTITQADGCTYLLAPTGATSPSAGSDASFALTASDQTCTWSASPNDAWISGVTSSGTGDGTITYHVGANVAPSRIGTIAVGGRTFSVTQADGCVAALTSTTLSPDASGGASTIGITMSDPSCTWTAGSNTSWVVLGSSGGTGDGSVLATTSSNAGPSRSTTIQVAGQTVNVNQGSGCTVALPTVHGLATSDGTSHGGFIVTTPAGCAFTATSSVPWLTNLVLTSSAVHYDVSSSDMPTRTGEITVTSTTTNSTATFSVLQTSGCVEVFSTAGAAAPIAGGAATADVQTATMCTYTATASASWVHNLQIGPNGIDYVVDANVGPARSARIDLVDTASHQTTSFAITQTSGCILVLPITAGQLAHDGGSGSFAVTAGAGCTWSASATAPWLSGLVATAQGVQFAVASSVDAARSAVITVQADGSDSTAQFTVNEASGCAVTLPVATAELGISGGNGAFDVDTGNGCTYSGASDAPWVSGISQAGTGLHFAADANTGVARTATLIVTATDTGATASFGIFQSGAIVTPQIVTQPSGASAFVGDPIVLTVVATGGDLHYQWSRNGTAISGATTANFRVLQAALGDTGSYGVVVSNGAGAVTSTAATVTVTVRPVDGGVMIPMDAGSIPDVTVVVDAPIDHGSMIVPIDASADVVDAHITVVDARPDAGVVVADAGPDVVVTGATDARPDAKIVKVPPADDAALAIDAGASPDAEDVTEPPSSDSGCSCRTASGGSDGRYAFALTGLALALFARRRRGKGKNIDERLI